MPKRKILVVDNEAEFASIVKLNLEHTNDYEVRIETKGASAVNAAKEFKPDLIFLDIFMPDMDGGSVLRLMKNEQELKEIPVGFLTALVDGKGVNAYDGFIAGQAYLAKPVTTAKLLACINKHLRY
jgi:CheY-like chemotaxis protein